jgi:cell division protein FtsL
MEAPMPNYNAVPKLKPKARPKATPSRPVRIPFKGTKWTKQDILPFAIGLVALFAMLLISTTVSNRASEATSQLRQTTAQIDKVQDSNNSARQEISNLTNADRLKEIAQKYGLNLNNGNIRNVK